MSHETASDRRPTLYRGGCHCAEVRFEAEIDFAAGIGRCNCTLCVKRGGAGAIIKPAAFRLLAGAESLGEYQFGQKVGHYRFCKRCGIHVFGHGHLEQLGGDFVSVNVLALDDIDPATLQYIYWDGRHDNWQAGPRPTPWPVAA